MTSRPARLAGWLPGLIALAGAALLVWRWSEGHPLWVDEEMLALNLRGRPFDRLAASLWLEQSAPLGWLWLERIVLLALGTGERALRLLPLLCGIGTLACAVWTGRRWLATAGATVLAVLCALAPWLAYHALELKPYSCDAFWAFLLPVLAAWAVDVDVVADARTSLRRQATWFAAAAVGLWFANGALLVAPACLVVLLVASWRRFGWRASLAIALGAVVWSASFGLHYAVSTRHTVASASLQHYWSFAMAPPDGGVPGAFRWALTRLQPLAEKPGGTTQPVLFWLAVAGGIVIAMRSRAAAGMLLLLVPLSALAWGVLRLVPVYERLSLWVVPALYVGVAVAAEGGIALVRRMRPRAPAVALAVAAVGAVGILVVDLARNSRSILLERRIDDAHGLDDRAGVRWLMRQRLPGDVVVTTRLALPAIWWYGGASWTPENGLRTSSGDVTPVFEAQLTSARPGCADRLLAQLGRPARLLVYLGFRRDDWPDAREALLLARVGEIGAITGFRPFAEIGGAMVVDARQPPGPWPQLPPRPWAAGKTMTSAGRNCVEVRPAQPW